MKKDTDKTEAQLINELDKARKRIAELEVSEAERRLMGEELVKSKAQLQALLDGSPDAIRQVDTNMRILWANKTTLDMNPDAIGQPCYKAIVDREEPCEGCPCKKAMKTGQIEKGVMYQPVVKGIQGESYWEDIGVPIRDHDGKIVGAIEITRNITERKRMEEELRTKGSAIALSINAITIVDLEGNLNYVNRSFLEMWGYDDDKEVLKKPAVAFWQVTGEASKVMEALRHKGSWIGELVAKRKDGSYFDVHLSASMVTDRSDTPICMMSSFVDITERKRMVEELRESEQKYRGLINNVKLGVFRSTPEPNGRFLAVNPAMEEITGYSRRELLQMNVADLYVYPEERKTTLDEMASARGKKTKELRFRKKDGTEIVVLDRRVAVRQESGEILYFDGIIENVTERKQAEEELRKLYVIEREKREKLESEERERLQFLNALAHELKTPLTAIVASAGLLMEEIDDKVGSPRVRLTENIIRAIKKLEARLSELLDMARIGIRGFKLNLELLDIRPILQNVVSELLPVAVEKKQALTLIEAKAIPMIWADKQRFEQVLVNLVTNAIKFTWEGDSIEVRVKKTGDELVVEVEDHGPGITSEEQERIFQPYYRIEADRQRFSGLGLGLALSKQLVELHGGRLWVRSDHGTGSIFAFSIPLKKPR